jgi:uncharacterized protein YecT (DUF1311 family)
MKKSLFIMFLMVPNLAHAELCDNPKTQSDINYCAEYVFTRADSDLNEIYGKFKSLLTDDNAATSALKKAQKSWLNFRDAECELEVIPSETGTSKTMVHFDCLSRLTKARIAEFQIRLDCQEGDFTCFTIGDAAD